MNLKSKDCRSLICDAYQMTFTDVISVNTDFDITGFMPYLYKPDKVNTSTEVVFTLFDLCIFQ